MKKLKFTAVLALMGASTAWGQTDVTSLYLTNADFEKTAATTSNVSGNDDCRTVDNWSYEKTPAGDNKYYRAAVFSYGSTVKLNNQTPPTTGPASGKKCLGIQTPWGCTLKLYQAATLDPGRYTIKFYLYKKVNKDIGTNYFGFVEDAGTTHYGTTKSFSENAWQTETVTFDLVERTAGKVSLGYKSAGNGSSENPHLFIDRVELIQELDGTALQKKYLAAELVTARKWAGANVGTAPFQRPVGAQTALNTVIEQAQGVHDKEDATEAECKAIRTTLSSALETYKNFELNVPSEDQLFNIINISPTYIPKGNAVTFKMGKNDAVAAKNPTMGYNEKPGSYLPQHIKFTATGEDNTYTLSYTNYAGTTIYVTTAGILDGKSEHKYLRVTTDPDKALKVKVIATDEEGVWNLYNTSYAMNIGANSETDQGFFTKDQWSSMKLTEAAKHEVQLNLTAEKPYSVLMLPYDAALPEGLKAYTVTTVNDRVLDLVEASTLTAMVPYVVYAEDGINHTFSGYGVAYTDGSFTNGLLTGVFTETAVPSGSYAFNYDKQGFFALAGGEKAAAHSAYFTLTGATAPGYYFNAADLLKLVKQNLKSDIEAAQAIVVARVDVGTDAFQIPEERLNTLQGAINEANGVYSSDAADVNVVETANTTLNTAVTTYNAHSVLNVPKEDEAFNLYLNDGFQKTVTFKDGNPGKGDYAIGYTEDAGSIYNQTVYCKAVADNTNTYYMYIVDAEGVKHYICTGAGGGYGGDNKQLRMTTEEAKALPILVTLTSVPGIYNLKNTVDNNLIGSNKSDGFYTASSYKDFKITPAVKASAQVVVTEAGYATIMLPFTAAVPEKVEAYTVDDVVGTTLTMNKVELLAANTPYVLKGAVTDVTLSGYGVAKKNTYEKGLLTGTYTEVTATADTYVLQNLEGNVAFYKVVEGSEPEIGANRAYLTMPASGEINALYFPTLGEETAAAEVKVADAVVDVLTINGVVVRKGVKASEALRGLKRGLYIVGGEKRVVNE